MAGVKGRSGSGGKRPGAGRKSGVTEQEVREELQKYLPDAYMAVQKDLTDPLYKIAPSVWRLLDKFIGDRKISEIVGPDDGAIQIVVTKDAQALKSDE